ncbi:MAG: hypothetical protein U0169_15870, partial [Polyangiaceae bacterium]
LGAVLFELLAGDTAFEGETFTSLVIRINNEAPRDLQALNPAVPDALVGIVRRCLEKNPADRFPNAAELAIALLPYARKRARVPAERAASITRDAGLGAATLVLPASELPPSMSLRDSAGRVSSSRMGVASSTNDAIVTPQESAPPSKRKKGVVLVALALLVVVVIAFFLGQRRGSETTGAAVVVHGPETEAKVAPSTVPVPSASAVVPTSAPVPPAPTTPSAPDAPVAATASAPKSAEPKSAMKAAPAPAAAPPKPKPKSSAGGLDIRMER